MGDLPAQAHQVSSDLQRLVASVSEELQRIVRTPVNPDLRRAALMAAAEAARNVLQDFDFHSGLVSARRQEDGSIRLKFAGMQGIALDEATAQAARDQLEVALHVPAPDRPTDPPSRL